MFLNTSSNPRKTLNRHDHPAQALGTRVAKIPMFCLRNRKTRRPLVERQRCPLGPFLQPISPGVLGALAVQDSRIGASSLTPECYEGGLLRLQ